MSKEITCKECGFTNPYSSKFCNNCGAKLPLSTHIICPSCETPNTRDRVFCDTCGTRLMPETTKIKPEEPKSSQPSPSSPFSLPTRRPGDTGELNPNAVPDWLRTGDIASNKEEIEASSKKDASDLPDWLMNDNDSEPIINAPTTISTEFYRDLVDKAEDLPQPDDLFADEEDANLPDWLSDAADSADAPNLRAGLTDWLSDLQDDRDEVDTAVPHEKDPEDVSSGLTDWLQELDDLNNLPAADEAPGFTPLAAAEEPEATDESDWLHELGPAQTDLFPSSDELAESKGEDDLPGWMDELGPLQTNLLDPSQIAQLTGPLGGMSEEDLVDDEAAGADVSFTNLFKTSSGATEALPSWLDAATEEGESFLADLPDEPAADLADEVIEEPDSDWFTVDQIVAETDLDWLEETGSLEQMMEAEAPEMLEVDDEDTFAFDDSALPEPLLPESDEEADADSDDDDDFDWLADMEAIQTGELVIDPEPEPELEAESEPEETAVPIEPQPTAQEPEGEGDTWSSDSLLAETTDGEDLPAWLEQLDDATKPDDAAPPTLGNEEMPAWIASMRPGEGIIGSELPGVFSEMDLRDTLEGIPEELAGAELPDWLQDTPLDAAPSVTAPSQTGQEASLEIPDWLQPGLDEESDKSSATVISEPVEKSSSRNEWRSLLDELPPLTPLAESLPRAEIPEWVQQLKPSELSGQPPREAEGSEAIAGPLKGMQGIVAIEPMIARPRVATLPTPYVTTPEQQQQVALLQQLTHETPDTVATLSTKPAYDTAVWLRFILSVLLLVALLAGLLGPNLVATPATPPENVLSVNSAVTTAAGQPVLLAVEYTPAMAGELSPQASLLLTQFAANGSPVLVVSQYAAGTAVAKTLAAESNVQFIGYLPGESIGLRQMGDCLGGRNACTQLNGRQLNPEIQTALSQVRLVVVLTGDRDHFVNWVEQVGAVTPELPMVAGVTQALAPLAKSYTTAGQLDSVLGGTPDTAVYEQLVNMPAGAAQTQLNAQIYGQLVAGVLLLIGLLAFGTTGFMHNRRQKKQQDISVKQP